LEPDYPEFLAKRLRSLGMIDSIRMVGKQANIPEWMQAMDVVVHASDREPFGLVVAEAMFLGKPAMATVPGGPGEMVRDGENGLLVSHGDAKALADAIENFLQDPDFAAACGHRAHKSALEFDSSLYARKVLNTINDLEADLGK